MLFWSCPGFETLAVKEFEEKLIQQNLNYRTKEIAEEETKAMNAPLTQANLSAFETRAPRQAEMLSDSSTVIDIAARHWEEENRSTVQSQSQVTA